jgi:hypothetical protein
MKKLVRNVLRPIKKLVRKVGGAFGKVMNKLGPIGMLAMMYVMPYLSNFWSTMGTTIGGTGAGGTAVAEVGKAAVQEATKKGLVEAGSKAAQNVALEAGQEAAKQSLLKEGSGKIAAKIASKYASGTGAPTGLFAGGTASKALGYTLKTLHNAASLSMNIFNTVTGAVSGAIDFVTGGSLTKLGDWVGDRFGDFQTRMGTATSEGYKKRLGTRLSNGDLTDSFLEIVKENQKGVFAQHSNLYPEGVYTPPAETLISKNLPSLKEQIDSGSLLASNDPNFSMENEALFKQEEVPADLGTMTITGNRKELLGDITIGGEGDFVNIDQLTKDTFNIDTSKLSTLPPVEGELNLLGKTREAASSFYEDIKRGIVGGETTTLVDEYKVDKAGVSYPTGVQIERTTIEPNILQKASSAAGDAVANLPKNMVDNYEQNWINRKLGNVPTYINKYNTTPSIPGITYDSRNDYVLEIPRDDRLVATNSYNNNNNGVYSGNPFATINFDKLNFDYGQGGIYGS